MRYIYLLGLLFSLSVCYSQDSKFIKGRCYMETGEGDSVRVTYLIDKYLAPQISKDALNHMLWCAEFYGKHGCKNQASFRPYKNSSLLIQREAGITTLWFTFLAKNDYGGEIELSETVKFDNSFNYLSDEVHAK